MSGRRINRFLSFFILVVFCISGVYQSFDLADSFFVCPNENNAAIYEESFVDFTKDVFVEDSSPLIQLIYNRKEHVSDSSDISNLFCSIDNISSSAKAEYTDICFGNVIQENCLEHFCCSAITNYIHLKDGQKIA